VFVFDVLVDPPTDRRTIVCGVAILVRETSGHYTYHQVSHSKTGNLQLQSSFVCCVTEKVTAIIFLYCIYLLAAVNPDCERGLCGTKRIIKQNSC
jgi:hypothetical protein